MATDGRRRWRRMQAMTDDPATTQRRLLAEILTTNADAAFARDHRFADAAANATPGSTGFSNMERRFRELVPVQNYDSLLPYIEQQEKTGDGLTAEQPVMYARTSGTTGTPKDIPVTGSTVDRLSATQRLYSYGLHRSTDAFRGSVLGIGGAAVEGYRSSGRPFGSATGLIYEQMPRVVRAKYVLPSQALGIEDYDTKYAVIAAMAMARADLTSIATANPSTVIRLADIIGQRWDELLAVVADGDPGRLGPLSADQLQAVRDGSRPNPGRARALERAMSAQGGTPGSDLGMIWPRLAALVGWTGGSCGFALNALQPRLPASTRSVEYGYSASEFRGTIGHDSSRFGIPTIWDNYFEFVPVEVHEGGDCGRPAWREAVVGVADLEPGRQYNLFVTTPDGLYRYDMNDVMEAGPRFGSTPTLAFVRKGRGVTNITGEKLSEEQVLAAMATAADTAGLQVPFFLAVADTSAARYRFFAEVVGGHVDPATMAQALDRGLAEANIEYKAKRSSGRLETVEFVPLSAGAGAAYRRSKIAGGQRDAQFKHLHLQPADDVEFDFATEGLLA
jgi:hypothetical protein